ncbi:putative DNA ligase 4 [Amylocarpus encephaloides]|uniref:DNA ligase n=1 Tax=Amylocarpus encephaloides TaxID=45428 RepID=A0A9P7YQC1_9HELO|nr:putative DNA ligase 4 [Amylocarpus encephaloides]
MPASQKSLDDGAVGGPRHDLQGPVMEEELDEKYPNRPHNKSRTFFFGDLIRLFNSLNSLKKQPSGPRVARAKVGPHGKRGQTSYEMREALIKRFISRWRNDVGTDFYPALRLILPEKDRDRPMYGLKEKAIGRLLVKLLKIGKDSEDGFNLLYWKLPGHTTATRMAGDFAGRCHEVLKKRAMINDDGDMRIEEVNKLLDQLSMAQKEDTQLPIFEQFYHRMNAEELMWLIRIILRQMKIGASEKTILTMWHPNADALFNVSSSLRRVCWELTDPENVLDDEDTGVELMECFQPQLAGFQENSFQRTVERLGVDPDKPEFWIEEKLDGERMQLHMISDDSYPGGKRFGFWSRKAKDYTYLYGSGFEDNHSALTRHIRDAFDPRVNNIILDGEMITWDPETDKIVAFGTLKTAALSEQKNPFQGTGIRPLFRVFDCLFLNDQNITQYILKDRRKALESAVKNVYRRLEVHKYQIAEKSSDIEPALRQIVAEASEGLVLKNPQSRYQLNSRNHDWMKVKPEYMLDFGESLDCVVIGGYYGSGRRGGGLSSFMCGLRVDQNHISAGANPIKCFSFFKVGGGFRAEDYATIRHMTEGKWIDWDRHNPPNDFIELAGGDRQFEKPDVWIKPNDSFVVEVKAASVGPSESFKTNYTLRFPRFKKLRPDKDWQSALSLSEFAILRTKIEQESEQKDFKVEGKRKVAKRMKKSLVAGADSKIKTPYAGPQTKVFEGLNFHVMTDMLHPSKKTKAEIEQIIKANGGDFFAGPTAKENTICIAEKKPVKVASLLKRNNTNIVKPSWIFDAIKQAEIDGPQRPRFLVPFEPVHMFHLLDDMRDSVASSVDDFGDSYTRDITPAELGKLCESMIHPKSSDFTADMLRLKLEERGRGFGEIPGNIFTRCIVRFVPGSKEELASPERGMDFVIGKNRLLFSGGKIVENDDAENITHFVILEEDGDTLKTLRDKLSKRRGPVPRIVKVDWLKESWGEKTLLDEERYAV